MAIGHSIGISLLDKAVKTTTAEVTVVEADITDWIADPSAAGVAHDWFAAVYGVTLLTLADERVIVNQPSIAAVPPTDDQAYRSAKLVVFYHDNTTGGKFHYSIGGRDTTKYNTYPRSKNVILTVAAGGTAAIEALVTATNALHTPDGGVAVVDQIVVGGGKQG